MKRRPAEQSRCPECGAVLRPADGEGGCCAACAGEGRGAEEARAKRDPRRRRAAIDPRMSHGDAAAAGRKR
jgi:hypothetical protein